MTLESTATAPRLYPRMMVELDVGSNTTLRLWSGAGETSYGGNTYYGLGGLLSITASSSTAGVQSDEFTVSIAYKGTALSVLRDEAMRHSIADNGFRAFLLLSNDPAFSVSHEIPFIMGKVSSITANRDQIDVSIYTAMHDATVSKTLARLWTDEHQRSYVDENDRAFRHVSGSTTREIDF